MKIDTDEETKKLVKELWDLMGKKRRLNFDVFDTESGEIIIPAHRTVLKRHCVRIAESRNHLGLRFFMLP